jgi:hypothetical protein
MKMTATPGNKEMKCEKQTKTKKDEKQHKKKQRISMSLRAFQEDSRYICSEKIPWNGQFPSFQNAFNGICMLQKYSLRHPAFRDDSHRTNLPSIS